MDEIWQAVFAYAMLWVMYVAAAIAEHYGLWGKGGSGETAICAVYLGVAVATCAFFWLFPTA